ncbi:MAG: hypothetical protein WCJ55_07160 [Chloroflexales bacterium]
MKPRRWYSSPEMKPDPAPSTTLHYASLIQLACAARTDRQQGPIIKLTPVESQNSRSRDLQVHATSTNIRRIDAA